MEHPKVIEAGAELGGPRAIGRVVAVWLEGALYASRKLTDGFVPTAIVARALTDDDPLAVAAALVHVGLWTAVAGGFRFHDWDDYNPDAETVRARQAEDRARKHKKGNGQSGPLLEQATAPGPIGFRPDSTRIPMGVRADSDAPVPVPVPSPSENQKQESTVRGRTKTPRYLRVTLDVWEVQTHVLAAVHYLCNQGAPYLDAHGQPAIGEILAAVKDIVAHDLHATWAPGELDAIVARALGRRARQIEAARVRAGRQIRARREFDRRRSA